MAKNPGKLYVIAAPSGAGKTSLVKALVDANDNIEVAISHTTRARRPNERDGMNYHFVSLAEFKAIEENAGFVEFACVYDNRYGTSKQAIEPILATGKHLVLEIDWQGAQQIRQSMPDSQSIFILPPTLKALTDRLQERAQDDPHTIAKRMDEAIRELSHFDEFDYLIVNDDFDLALQHLQSITNNTAPELLLSRQKENLRHLLSELLPTG